MINLIVKGTGFLDVGGDELYKNNSKKEVKKAFHKAMGSTVKDVKKEGKTLISKYFPGSKPSFKDTWKEKRFNNNSKFETAIVYNKVPWFSMYEVGGTINGKLVVPLYNKKNNRIDIKKWRATLKVLKASGKSFFKKVNGNILLFMITGKNKATPIGIVVNRVSIKKRFAFSNKLKQVADKNLPIWFERYLDLSNI